MAKKTTAIAWTDKTDNVIRGCSRKCATGSKISGCGDGTGGGCYAEQMAWRIVQMDRAKGIPEGQGKYDGLVRMTPTGPRWTGVVRLDRDDLMKLLRQRPRTRSRRFINSMSDVFHTALPQDDLDLFWAVLLIQCRHEMAGKQTIQILTKRALEMRDYLSSPATLERVARVAGRLMEDGDGWHDSILYNPLGLADPLIHLGVSVEHQAAADERVPLLLQTPAVYRFLSCEPLLGPVELWRVNDGSWWDKEGAHLYNALTGTAFYSDGEYGLGGGPRIDQVIVGCESGDGARPADVDWLRSLRDQCVTSGVRIFLKQAMPGNGITGGENSWSKQSGPIEQPYLDGVQHLELIEVAAA